MKKILIAVFCFLSLFSKGQVYQSMPQYGYAAHRMSFDSTLQIPTFCGVPTLKSNVLKFGAIAFDSCNNRFYFYNPKTAVWDTIKSGGGSTDTTSLSNRINLKLNISDTSAMLTKYLRKTDTTNKFVTSVTKLNDSTIRVIKNTTTTDITLTPSQTVTNATRLITTVYNKSGATITKGSVVYIDGAHSSNLPTIALAKANQESTSAYTYGLVETDITDNSSGTVIQVGVITNLNLPTNTYTDGQTLYLSPTVAGGYTTTKPLAPYHYVAIGTVTKAHPVTGTIQIAIRNGFQLDEMSDVSIALVPLDSTILQFSRVDSLWHDVNPTTAMGNRFVKVADSSAMLSKYLRKNDTSTLSSRINLQVNISDTATMLTPYSRKFAAAYTINANNTNAAASESTQTFRDSAQKAYTGSISWTGTTAPSGATNHSYRWFQVGKLVTLRITLIYATAGAALTSVLCSLPSDCPTPEIPTGSTANSSYLYIGSGTLSTAVTAGGISGTINGGISELRINSGGTGYEILISRFAAGYATARATIQYFAQ